MTFCFSMKPHILLYQIHSDKETDEFCSLPFEKMVDVVAIKTGDDDCALFRHFWTVDFKQCVKDFPAYEKMKTWDDKSCPNSQTCQNVAVYLQHVCWSMKTAGFQLRAAVAFATKFGFSPALATDPKYADNRQATHRKAASKWLIGPSCLAVVIWE